MWKRVKQVWLLDSAMRKLIIEAIFYLGWARILKALPFQRVAPLLGTPMKDTSTAERPSDGPVLQKISLAIHTASRQTWWESMCLVKAIAAQKMLERRHIDSTLYLGTSRDDSGRMIAHAWLRSGSFIITGAEERDRFTVVGKFGKQADQSRK